MAKMKTFYSRRMKFITMTVEKVTRALSFWIDSFVRCFILAVYLADLILLLFCAHEIQAEKFQ